MASERIVDQIAAKGIKSPVRTLNLPKKGRHVPRSISFVKGKIKVTCKCGTVLPKTDGNFETEKTWHEHAEQGRTW